MAAGAMGWQSTVNAEHTEAETRRRADTDNRHKTHTHAHTHTLSLFVCIITCKNAVVLLHVTCKAVDVARAHVAGQAAPCRVRVLGCSHLQSGVLWVGE